MSSYASPSSALPGLLLQIPAVIRLQCFVLISTQFLLESIVHIVLLGKPYENLVSLHKKSHIFLFESWNS